MSDSENFNRLIRLLARGGTITIRKSLDKYSTPVKFADYIYQNQMKVLKLKFYQNQRALVVARDIDKMDITLLGKLLLELFKDKMTPKEQACVNGIKEERDKFMHSEMLETAEVSTPLFNQKWQDISALLLDLADEIGDPVFVTELKDFIENTKKSSPGFAEIHKILVDWCQSNKELENKLDSLAETVKKMKVQQEVYSKMTHNTRQDSFKDKFLSHYEYTTRIKNPLTQVMIRAKDHLFNGFSVVIYGRPGEGKTTAAFMIVKCLVDEGTLDLNRCVILFDPDDLKDVASADVDLLLIDDMFGKHNAEIGKFNGWSKFFATLQTFVTNQKVRIIITSRLHVFLEYRNKLAGLEVFSRVIELNSADLSVDEKQQILLAQLKINGRDTDDLDIRDCVSKDQSNFGFPLCAHQFASDLELYSKKQEYFSKPYKYYLEQNIHNLDDESFIALLYVFYKRNKLQATDLDITKMDKGSENTLLHIARLRGVDKPAAKIIRETKQKVNYLKDSYIRNIRKTYSFLHDTIYETVALVHGEEYPSEVIAQCTVDFLCQSVRVERTIEEGFLIIEDEDFTSLAERIVNEVTKESNGARLSTHPVLNNQQFVEELINVLTENEDTFREFFSTSLSFMYVGSHAFLYHVIYCESNNDTFLQEVLPQLKCTHDNSNKASCWKCRVKSEALAAACALNRQDLYYILLDAGCQVETLCLYKAVENNDISPDFVKNIYHDLKKGNIFIPDKELLQFCLGLSIQHKDTRVFNILKECGLKLSSEVIYYIVQTGDINLLSSTLGDLIKEKKWKPDAMSVSRALVEALINNRHDILQTLEQAGAKLTEFAVYWAILDHGYEAVTTVVEKLLENDTFDVESRDMAWAMAMAIQKKTEDDRIYKRLKDVGVISTMSLVGALVETGQNIDEINHVIEELKMHGRWDVEDYSVAVAYMAACKRPDTTLKTVLESEGAAITPPCLNYAVIRYPDQVDFIIRSLKAAGKFNPSNKYIARAFVWSLECADKKIYNQLIQEGVELSMACLASAVERFISLPTLENVIAGLKVEKKWNINDDFALEALCVANKRPDKAAYMRLISEGINWNPRSLYIAVECETVYGLKQVIKQLKDKSVLEVSNVDIQAAVSLASSLKDSRKYRVLKELGL